MFSGAEGKPGSNIEILPLAAVDGIFGTSLQMLPSEPFMNARGSCRLLEKRGLLSVSHFEKCGGGGGGIYLAAGKRNVCSNYIF
jgi:hypothetical protein